MKAFINSAKAISPQDTFYGLFPLNKLNTYMGQLTAIEPNYKDFINPMKLRRMSHIIRMGLATALTCIKDAGIEKPDGIISATGWGCLADTFDFLDEIKDKKEVALSPATFIQSTHNTIGGHIALSLDCQEYNSVVVNHKSSFEQGLIEALLLIIEGKESILVGGLDELSQKDIELKRQANYWKDKDFKNISLFKSNSHGTLPGEGAAYFILGKKKSTYCTSQIDDVYFLSAELSASELGEQGNFDLILSGYNGDKRVLAGYPEAIATNTFVPLIGYYKHLCGEYDTASSFALWLADQMIKTQQIPIYLLSDVGCKIPLQINRILIHHYTEPDQHAFIVVSKTGT